MKTYELIERLRGIRSNMQGLRFSILEDNQEFNSVEHPAYKALASAEMELVEAIVNLEADVVF